MSLVDAALYAEVAQFLAREALLLDEGADDAWLELLADDLDYGVPVRQATLPRENELARTTYRFRDTKADVQTRLARTSTGHAYSEVPPSRTLRVVGSIVARHGAEPDLIEASSALLLFRQRGIDKHYDLIPCRRNDVLRRTEDGLRLVKREVITTETSLMTPNLGVFV